MILFKFDCLNVFDNINIYKNAHESPWTMRVPLIFLAFGSVFIGIFFAKYYIGDLKDNFWNNAIILVQHSNNHLPFIQNLIIKSSVATGILIATYLYFYNINIPLKLSKNLNIFYSISYNRWYVDEIYNFIFVRPLFYLSTIFCRCN